ncbi:neurensin-2 [Eublepharis macularius]|uniref:Neurensin-2 n=1 Tax=Eublepharis macularius TaxID=481883 RepID=A0AA97JE47_EUBMA|nr:neurensin-2 [Eublepharis macularius]
MPATCDPLCGCRCGSNVEQGKWYGVHSYLHLFYEDCTSAHLDEASKPSTTTACSGWTSVLWKVTLSAGILLSLIGAAALATGFLLPPKMEGISAEEFVVLDQQAVEYNYALGICRAVGTVLCTVAGVLLVTCALSFTLARVNREGKPREAEEAEEEPRSPLLPENPPGQGSAVGTTTPLGFRPSWVQSIWPTTDVKSLQGPLRSASKAPAQTPSSGLASVR